MPITKHRRANMSVQAIMQVLTEHGKDANACLEGTELAAGDILNADTHIADDVEIGILERALAQLPPQAGYGMRAGKTLRPSTYGVLGLAILTSPKVHDALETLTRFAGPFLLSKIRLETRGSQASVVVDMHALPETIQRYVFERVYSTFLTFLAELMPGLDTTMFELHLPFADAAYADQLHAVTGNPVVGGQSEFAFVTSADWLDQPLAQADPVLNAHFTKQLQTLLKSRQDLPDNAQFVREHMISRNCYTPLLDDVAALAGLSSRSFRRRLQEEGTSFQEIVLSTKMTIAKELLCAAGLTVNDTARRLGYSEPASFSRAYNRYWGQNPGKANHQDNSKPSLAETT